MTRQYGPEIAASLERAEQSIEAARGLLGSEFYDFAASRAYYAAFYAATAVLLAEGLEFGKHSGVIASVHRRLVKTGRLAKEQGQGLNWLFGLRNVGDYGVTAHVSREDAQQAIQVAASFIDTIKVLLGVS